MAENMPQTRTVAEPNPPRAQQVSASATSRNLRDRPVRTSTSPVRMNSGTAVSAKASMPENSDSPRSDIGTAPDHQISAAQQAPMAAQTGTPSAQRITNSATGP